MNGGRLDELDPSVELVCVLAGLHRDPDLDEVGQVAAVAGWERVIAWATAMQAELLLAIDQDADLTRYGWHSADAARSLCEQLGLALGISGGSAAHRLADAAALVEKAPAVHRALKTGALTVSHARAAASGAAVLDAVTARQVAVATVTDPVWRTPAQFADTWNRHVVELDPGGAEERHRQARRGRRVSRRAEAEGMGSLWALLPAEDTDAVHDTLDACARSSLATNLAGDERSLDERRADALVQLVCGQITNGYRGPVPSARCTCGGEPDVGGPDDVGEIGGEGAARSRHSGAPRECGCGGSTAAPSEPTRHGRRATVQVTVSWSTLIGADDAPALLAGYGVIDAPTARRIAADPTSVWRRLLVEPTSGRLLDYGRTVYRPPQDLQDFVTARDRCCRFPGCERVAAACDLDHRTDWELGGTTCADCLDCLCRRHHLLRHRGGWGHRRDPATGDSVWTDPHGSTHTRPATILPTPEPVQPPAGGSAPPGAAGSDATRSPVNRPAAIGPPPF